MPIPKLLKRQCVAALRGACPGGLCAWWWYIPEKKKAGCSLRETASFADGRECFGMCTRDPMFAGNRFGASDRGAASSTPCGHVGYDYFTLPWCPCCRDRLPRWFRDEFEPEPYDRKAWRRKRYERREKGRRRALKRFRPCGARAA